MTYEPASGEAKNLGMPMPLGYPGLPTNSKTIDANLDSEGEGVIDVTADEKRDLLYVVTCEHSYWMVYDLKHPEKGYRLLGPKNEKAEMEKRDLLGQPNTLVDKDGRATEITADYRIVRYDPATDKVTLDALTLDGKSIPDTIAESLKRYKYSDCFDWRLAEDGRTAYLVFLSDLRLFQIDLGGKAGEPVRGKSVGNRVEGKHPDLRGSLKHRARRDRLFLALRRGQRDRLRPRLPASFGEIRPETEQDDRPRRIRRQEPGLLRLQGPAREKSRRLGAPAP